MCMVTVLRITVLPEQTDFIILTSIPPSLMEIPLQIKRKLDMKLTDEERVNDLDESSYLNGMDLQ